MSGTTISTNLSVGIDLTSASQALLTVEDTASVFASGNYAAAIYATLNVSPVIDNQGVLSGGGYGVSLHDGGTITNGSAAMPTAQIAGGYDGVLAGARGGVSVTNFGTIASNGFSSGTGISAGGSGNIVNGSAADATALIAGYFEGVLIGGAGAVTNFGTISASGTSTELGLSSVGVYLRSGGTILNGSATDLAATITGVDFAVEVMHAPGTVNNFGTIAGTGALARGVLLADGGTVANGSLSDTTATISAQDKNGVYTGGTIVSSVTNFGTITGGKNGVSLQDGGTLVNGAPGSPAAYIAGARQGVYVGGTAASSVLNYGTLASTGGFWGASVYLGGAITNGSASDTTALITGGGGIYEGGVASVVNYGTILATARTGVDMLAGGTLINHGTIIGGSGNDAVYLGNANSVLALAPGSVLEGAVQAGTGDNTLELMAGLGTLSGLGQSITGFATIQVDAGADWTLGAVNAAPTLALAGTLNVAGSLDVTAPLAQSGSIALGLGATLEVGPVTGTGPSLTFLGDNTLVVDSLATFGTNGGSVGPLLQGFAASDTIDLRDLPPAGALVVDSYADTGEVVISHGTGGTPLGILHFQPSFIAHGSFALASDDRGGTLLTHS